MKLTVVLSAALFAAVTSAQTSVRIINQRNHAFVDLDIPYGGAQGNLGPQLHGTLLHDLLASAFTLRANSSGMQCQLNFNNNPRKHYLTNEHMDYIGFAPPSQPISLANARMDCRVANV
ncbi:unnamed protein product [Diplocarpon coronariae]